MKLVNKVILLMGLSLSPLAAVYAQASGVSEQCFKTTSQNRMQFNWPRSGKVAVVERVAKVSHEAELSYELHIAPIDDSKDANLKISYHNVEVLSFNGVNAKDPSVANSANSIKMMALMVPELIIDSNGQFVDIDLGPSVVEKIISALPKEPVEGAPTEFQIRETLSNARIQLIHKRKAVKMWNAMVEGWLDFPNAVGKKYLCHGEDIFYAKTLPTDIHYQQMPHNKKGQVSLKMDSSIKQRSAISVLQGMFQNMAVGTQPVVESAVQSYKADVVTDPNTLKPLYVATEFTSGVKIKDRADTTKVEKHSYQFSW